MSARSTVEEREIKSIELKATIILQASQSKPMLQVTNHSLYDLYFKGNPPGNIFYKIRFWDELSKSWKDGKEKNNPLKMSFRLLRSSESVLIDFPTDLAGPKKAPVEFGLYIKWNPNEKKLSLNTKEGSQPSESGWVYSSVPIESKTFF